jgi:hypothetical protein
MHAASVSRGSHEKTPVWRRNDNADGSKLYQGISQRKWEIYLVINFDKFRHNVCLIQVNRLLTKGWPDYAECSSNSSSNSSSANFEVVFASSAASDLQRSFVNTDAICALLSGNFSSCSSDPVIQNVNS